MKIHIDTMTEKFDSMIGEGEMIKNKVKEIEKVVAGQKETIKDKEAKLKERDCLIKNLRVAKEEGEKKIKNLEGECAQLKLKTQAKFNMEEI